MSFSRIRTGICRAPRLNFDRFRSISPTVAILTVLAIALVETPSRAALSVFGVICRSGLAKLLITLARWNPGVSAHIMRQQTCRIGKCSGIIAQQGYLDFRTGRPVLSETGTDARNDRELTADRGFERLLGEVSLSPRNEIDRDGRSSDLPYRTDASGGAGITVGVDSAGPPGILRQSRRRIGQPGENQEKTSVPTGRAGKTRSRRSSNAHPDILGWSPTPHRRAAALDAAAALRLIVDDRPL